MTTPRRRRPGLRDGEAIERYEKAGQLVSFYRCEGWKEDRDWAFGPIPEEEEGKEALAIPK